MKVGFKLEEIQMTPSPIDCIMNIASGVATLRAWKSTTTFEIYADVKSLLFQIEID